MIKLAYNPRFTAKLCRDEITAEYYYEFELLVSDHEIRQFLEDKNKFKLFDGIFVCPSGLMFEIESHNSWSGHFGVHWCVMIRPLRENGKPYIYDIPEQWDKHHHPQAPIHETL